MILADTWFWLAFANRRDAHHERAKAALAKHHSPYVTTRPVMTRRVTCVRAPALSVLRARP